MISIKDEMIKNITKVIARKEVIELLEKIIIDNGCSGSCAYCCVDFQPSCDSCGLYSLAELLIADHSDHSLKDDVAKLLLEKIKESIAEIVEE